MNIPKERCITCTAKREPSQMKFIERTGNWICNDCFVTTTDGFYYYRILDLIDQVNELKGQPTEDGECK